MITASTNDALPMTSVGRRIELAKLRDPFNAGDIDWRVAHCGKHNKRYWAKVLAKRPIALALTRFQSPIGTCV
jgi:hypothetical protein